MLKFTIMPIQNLLHPSLWPDLTSSTFDTVYAKGAAQFEFF